jgi:hypothetical protein
MPLRDLVLSVAEPSTPLPAQFFLYVDAGHAPEVS